MIRESKAMREIHKIREYLYEKRKNMPDIEIINDINNTAEKFMEEQHLILKRSKKKTFDENAKAA